MGGSAVRMRKVADRKRRLRAGSVVLGFPVLPVRPPWQATNKSRLLDFLNGVTRFTAHATSPAYS